MKNGFLKDYLAGSATTTALAVPEGDQAHEMPIHGEVHSVAEGASDDQWESDLVFTRADLRDVVPHDNVPVAI